MDKKGKKRLSILKKMPNTENDETLTVTKINRRISFSQKKSVKEFLVDDQRATIWINSYEEADGNSNLQQQSLEPNSTAQLNHHVSVIPPENKENLLEIGEEDRMTLRNRKSIIKRHALKPIKHDYQDIPSTSHPIPPPTFSPKNNQVMETVVLPVNIPPPTQLLDDSGTRKRILSVNTAMLPTTPEIQKKVQRLGVLRHSLQSSSYVTDSLDSLENMNLSQFPSRIFQPEFDLSYNYSKSEFKKGTCEKIREQSNVQVDEMDLSMGIEDMLLEPRPEKPVETPGRQTIFYANEIVDQSTVAGDRSAMAIVGDTDELNDMEITEIENDTNNLPATAFQQQRETIFCHGKDLEFTIVDQASATVTKIDKKVQPVDENRKTIYYMATDLEISNVQETQKEGVDNRGTIFCRNDSLEVSETHVLTSNSKNGNDKRGTIYFTNHKPDMTIQNPKDVETMISSVQHVNGVNRGTIFFPNETPEMSLTIEGVEPLSPSTHCVPKREATYFCCDEPIDISIAETSANVVTTMSPVAEKKDVRRTIYFPKGTEPDTTPEIKSTEPKPLRGTIIFRNETIEDSSIVTTSFNPIDESTKVFTKNQRGTIYFGATTPDATLIPTTHHEDDENVENYTRFSEPKTRRTTICRNESIDESIVQNPENIIDESTKITTKNHRKTVYVADIAPDTTLIPTTQHEVDGKAKNFPRLSESKSRGTIFCRNESIDESIVQNPENLIDESTKITTKNHRKTVYVADIAPDTTLIPTTHHEVDGKAKNFPRLSESKSRGTIFCCNESIDESIVQNPENIIDESTKITTKNHRKTVYIADITPDTTLVQPMRYEKDKKKFRNVSQLSQTRYFSDNSMIDVSPSTTVGNAKDYEQIPIKKHRRTIYCDSAELEMTIAATQNETLPSVAPVDNQSIEMDISKTEEEDCLNDENYPATINQRTIFFRNETLDMTTAKGDETKRFKLQRMSIKPNRLLAGCHPIGGNEINVNEATTVTTSPVVARSLNRLIDNSMYQEHRKSGSWNANTVTEEMEISDIHPVAVDPMPSTNVIQQTEQEVTENFSWVKRKTIGEPAESDTESGDEIEPTPPEVESQTVAQTNEIVAQELFETSNPNLSSVYYKYLPSNILKSFSRDSVYSPNSTELLCNFDPQNIMATTRTPSSPKSNTTENVIFRSVRPATPGKSKIPVRLNDIKDYVADPLSISDISLDMPRDVKIIEQQSLIRDTIKSPDLLHLTLGRYSEDRYSNERIDQTSMQLVTESDNECTPFPTSFVPQPFQQPLSGENYELTPPTVEQIKTVDIQRTTYSTRTTEWAVEPKLLETPQLRRNTHRSTRQYKKPVLNFDCLHQFESVTSVSDMLIDHKKKIANLSVNESFAVATEYGPETPSIRFLMENYRESYMTKLLNEKQHEIYYRPLFPKIPRPNFLIKNKLQEFKNYWRLKDSLAPNGIWVFTHNLVRGFELKITYDYFQPYGDGIIRFDRVFTMMSPTKLITTTTDLLLSISVYKRLPQEMCAMCPTSDSVLNFLADLNRQILEMVAKVNAIVDVVTTSCSTLSHNEETGECFITKNVLDLERREVFQFQIQLKYMDTVCFKDLSVKPTLDFHDNIRNLSEGLPFIDGILNRTSEYFDLKKCF